MTLSEIKGFPEKLLKGKEVNLYKAFFFIREDLKKDDDDQKMHVNESMEMLAISPEAAVDHLLYSIPAEAYVAQMNNIVDESIQEKEWLYRNMIIEQKESKDNTDILTVTMDNIEVAFLQLIFPCDELLKKDLLSEGEEVFFDGNILSVTLTGKEYKMDVFDKKLLSFKVEINGDTGKKVISKVKLEDIK